MPGSAPPYLSLGPRISRHKVNCATAESTRDLTDNDGWIDGWVGDGVGDLEVGGHNVIRGSSLQTQTKTPAAAVTSVDFEIIADFRSSLPDGTFTRDRDRIHL